MTLKEYNTIEQLKKEAWSTLFEAFENGLYKNEFEVMEQYNLICDRLSLGLA